MDVKVSLHTQLWQAARAGGGDARTLGPGLRLLKLRAEMILVTGVGHVLSQLICAPQVGMSVERLEMFSKFPIG